MSPGSPGLIFFVRRGFCLTKKSFTVLCFRLSGGMVFPYLNIAEHING